MLNLKRLFPKKQKKSKFPPLSSAARAAESGILAYPVEDILAANQDIIDKIYQVCRYDSEHFDTHYMPIITRYAEIVHLLPASQNHHHRDAGGLFRHGLEVGLYALNTITNFEFGLTLTKEGAARHKTAPRWDLGCFINGMGHDLPKAITDMEVFCPHLKITWNPYEMPLSDWLAKHQIERYQIRYKSGRGKKHELLTATLIFDWLLTPEIKAYLLEGDAELLSYMHAAFSNSSEKNVYRDYVTRADQHSLERYLQTAPATVSPAVEPGMAVHEHVELAVKRLLVDEIWGINVPGEVAWRINGQLYLVWPRAAHDIVMLLDKDNIPGIPRDPEVLAQILADWHVIVPSSCQQSPYWTIAPDALQKNGIRASLKAVRLSSRTNWISPLPPSVPGDVVTVAEEPPVPESTETMLPEDNRHNPVVEEFHQLLYSTEPPFSVQIIGQQAYVSKSDAEIWFSGRGVSRVKLLQMISNGELALLKREGQTPLIGTSLPETTKW